MFGKIPGHFVSLGIAFAIIPNGITCYVSLPYIIKSHMLLFMLCFKFMCATCLTLYYVYVIFICVYLWSWPKFEPLFLTIFLTCETYIYVTKWLVT